MKKLAIPIVMSLVLAMGGCGASQVQEGSSASAGGAASEAASAKTAEAKTLSGKTASSTKRAKRVKVSFTFTGMPTEASNQVALWVENSKGKVVRTLYVSDFTAASRGFERRAQTLSHWVSGAKAKKMSQKALDAVSGATLASGKQSFSWDLRDSKGKKVKAGTYTIKLEGTLYWKSNVLYSAKVKLPKAKTGKLSVKTKRSSKKSKNAKMLSKVKMTVR